MRRSLPILALGLVAGVATLAAAGAVTPRPAAAKGRLQAFGSCGALLDHVRKQATPLVGPWGLAGAPGIAVDDRAGGAPALSGPAAPGAPESDSSTTNVQEAGVDEPDIVKTDGSTIFAVAQGKLNAVDVRGRTPRLVGSLALPGGRGQQLLLRGTRLLVLTGGGAVQPLGGAADSLMFPAQLGTTLSEVDVSNPSAMQIVRTLEAEGSYLSARLVGRTARVVLTSSVPRPLEFVYPGSPGVESAAEATERNRAVVASAPLASWLPSYRLEDRRSGESRRRVLAQCRQIRRPASFSGMGLLTVLTIDLDRGLQPVDSDAVMTDGQIVYSSTRSLYVATQRWQDRPQPPTPGADTEPPRTTTVVHRFDVSDPASTHYRSSGEVPGTLLNQWSLSEHEGVLRVASTELPVWWTPDPGREGESFVSVLKEQGGKLGLVARVGGLGRGERIYAVRFIGDVGYVVTFRQVDPLYTIDLSTPERPRVLGELKILGYSAYLHPVDEDLVLGLGQDATEQGRILGAQLSLFDIRDLRRPVRLHRRTIGPGGSEAEYDHHAFLYWKPTRLVVVPVQTYGTGAEKGGDTFAGAIALRVGRERGLQELGRVTHPALGGAGGEPAVAYPIRRSLVVRNVLYTMSEAGIKANHAGTLADEGWAAFPVPEGSGTGVVKPDETTPPPPRTGG